MPKMLLNQHIFKPIDHQKTNLRSKKMVKKPHDYDKIRDIFLCPIGNYYGEFTPQKLIFNSNLQLFAQQVINLCNLEAKGKISPEETYDEIKRLWKQLKYSKKELSKGTNFTSEQ